MSQARVQTQTTWSRDGHINHEAIGFCYASGVSLSLSYLVASIVVVDTLHITYILSIFESAGRKSTPHGKQHSLNLKQHDREAFCVDPVELVHQAPATFLQRNEEKRNDWHNNKTTIIPRSCQTIKVSKVLTSAKPMMIFPTAAEDIFGEQLRVTMYRPSRDARP